MDISKLTPIIDPFNNDLFIKYTAIRDLKTRIQISGICNPKPLH